MCLSSHVKSTSPEEENLMLQDDEDLERMAKGEGFKVETEVRAVFLLC